MNFYWGVLLQHLAVGEWALDLVVGIKVGYLLGTDTVALEHEWVDLGRSDSWVYLVKGVALWSGLSWMGLLSTLWLVRAIGCKATTLQ